MLGLQERLLLLQLPVLSRKLLLSLRAMCQPSSQAQRAYADEACSEPMAHPLLRIKCLESLKRTDVEGSI